MFFELHDENRIGYKQLTDADLGRSPRSHQTHIGLFDDVLTFLPNQIEIPDAMVIFNDDVELLTASFDRIENPNHTYRSPKIKTGGRDVVSVVSFIRDKANDYSANELWYLFWFGLKSEQPVFFLFNKSSSTYNEVINLGIDLYGQVKSRLTPNDAPYRPILEYLEGIVNNSGKTILEELEVVAQTSEKATQTYRAYDIKKASKRFELIGRKGEELINTYFIKKLKRNQIESFHWVNEEKESGMPYDFFFQTLDGEVFYLDVKTTDYGFDQKMIFSSQEIDFVNNCSNKYCIYRVYSDENDKESKHLKICNNAKDLFKPIHEKTEFLKCELNEMAKIETIKLAVLPLHKALVFEPEITL